MLLLRTVSNKIIYAVPKNLIAGFDDRTLFWINQGLIKTKPKIGKFCLHNRVSNETARLAYMNCPNPTEPANQCITGKYYKII